MGANGEQNLRNDQTYRDEDDENCPDNRHHEEFSFLPLDSNSLQPYFMNQQITPTITSSYRNI
jgi:hypothetical protein